MTDLSSDYLGSFPQLTGTPPALDLEKLPAEPRLLFAQWFQEAVDAGVPEPKSVTLATVDSDGLPDARTVDLQSVDDNGWTFVTGAASTKAAQLKANPAAALNFWWQPQVRAVRVRGEATLVPLGEHAQAWQISPKFVEFWQSTAQQENTRIRYRKTATGWERTIEN